MSMLPGIENKEHPARTHYERETVKVAENVNAPIYTKVTTYPDGSLETEMVDAQEYKDAEAYGVECKDLGARR